WRKEDKQSQGSYDVADKVDQITENCGKEEAMIRSDIRHGLFDVPWNNQTRINEKLDEENRSGEHVAKAGDQCRLPQGQSFIVCQNVWLKKEAASALIFAFLMQQKPSAAQF